MYRQVLESIAGIEIWPVIALVIFMAVFAAVFVWTIRLDKKTVEELSNLPLQEKRPIQNWEQSNG